MAAKESNFVGEWRQVMPPTGRESVFIRFQQHGRLEYVIEGETIQTFVLTWKIDGDTIVSDQPSAPRVDVTKYQFESPARLRLEREDETYIYERYA